MLPIFAARVVVMHSVVGGFWIDKILRQLWERTGRFLWHLIAQLCDWVWDELRTVFGWLFDWAVSQLPTGWLTWWHSSAFTTQLFGFGEIADYLLPWKQALFMWFFATTIVAAVRLLRWVLGIQVLGNSLNA